MRLRLLLLCSFVFAACASEAPADPAPPVRTTAAQEYAPATPADEFGDYWYQGLAEITSYDLEQARYGALRDGEAVLIFVTEPFSRSKQVKLDQAGGEDDVTVLKLNATRTFLTGIYPYSMMTSVFTPVSEGPLPLKVTATSQEWCGHTFTQLNYGDGGYALQLRSYFESEGDVDADLPEVMPEDGLWSVIRIDPDALPTGDLRLIPGTIEQRFSHRAFAAEAATATLSAPDAEDVRTYTVAYPDLGRTLAIRFTGAFPHTIEGWTETQRSGGQALTTTATRRAREMLAYWSLNGVEDTSYRADLGLE